MSTKKRARRKHKHDESYACVNVRFHFRHRIMLPFVSHFHILHNALCLPSKILHKHCFQFLLGLTIIPREIENSAYAKFLGLTKCIMENVEVANTYACAFVAQC